jgi:hypothetical protein
VSAIRPIDAIERVVDRTRRELDVETRYRVDKRGSAAIEGEGKCASVERCEDHTGMSAMSTIERS